MTGPKCRICRRLGVKLFLKGERCFTQKCEIIKRNYPPGLRNKKRRGKISNYGKGLIEKQKLKNWYNLSEEQFSRYVKKILKEKKGQTEINTGDQLIKVLEGRLDNIVYKMGFAVSRILARQMVNHGHFEVNGQKIDIPSYQIKEGDEVGVRASSKNKKKFQLIKETLKEFNPSPWLFLDKAQIKGKVIKLPSSEEANVPVETSIIFEFYSK